MEVKKIVEGMTAVEVAEVIDSNFKNQNKILEEDIVKQNNVIGVSEYKDFSEDEAVNVGDVRKYNGFLYECVEATTGAFDASKWKKSSFKAETEKKLSEASKAIDNANKNNERANQKIEELRSSVVDDKPDSFYITDAIGNVLAKLDREGLSTISVKVLKDGSLVDLLSFIESNKTDLEDYIKIEEDDSFSVSDSMGNKVAVIDKNGLRDINIDPSKDDEFVICDSKGFIIAKIDKLGIHSVNASVGNAVKTEDNGYIPSGIMLNIIYGQSLTFHGSLPNGLDLYSMLKFDNQFDYTMSNCTEEMLNDTALLDSYFKKSFVPAVSKNYRGTAAAHANRKYMELLRDENGVDILMKEGIEPFYQFQLVNIKPSEVNSWEELSNRNGLYYRRLITAVRYGKKISEKMGIPFCVGSLIYMQGESNADNSDSIKQWYDKLWALFSIINKDVKDITGQDNDVLFLPYQMASHDAEGIRQYATSNLALAELKISLEDGVAEDGYNLSSTAKSIMTGNDTLIDRKNIQMGAVMVSLDYASDNDHIHASEHSYLAAGAQFGVQMKRCIYDGKPIKPIHPISHRVNLTEEGKYLLNVKFHVPCKPLVLDTENKECQSQRANNPNYGFTMIKNGSDIIESVKLVGNDSICFLCSQNPNGLVLQYAKDGWENGGNLRDSQNIKYIVSDFSYDVRNWCPILDYEI